MPISSEKWHKASVFDFPLLCEKQVWKYCSVVCNFFCSPQPLLSFSTCLMAWGTSEDLKSIVIGLIVFPGNQKKRAPALGYLYRAACSLKSWPLSSQKFMYRAVWKSHVPSELNGHWISWDLVGVNCQQSKLLCIV